MKENKAERIKLEKDGLDVWADIERYATTGFESIDADDLDRFKWYGLYTQRPAEDGFFMLRIKAPNGVINADQLETIGWLSQVYAGSSGDITTRQGIQLHYVRIQDAPHIVSELNKVGLTTQEACGDVVRNVVGCPLAGIDDEELFDAAGLVEKVTEKFLNNREFSNLPRKFKISITGCRHQCAQHEINDIGLVAVINEDGDPGFDLSIGGGLGARPQLAKRLGVFVWYSEVIEVITRIVEIFRDHGYRDDRRKARLKFLVADWGIERFREELESRLGRRLDDSHLNQLPSPALRDHTGIFAQRQLGLNYIGVAVLRGRISGEQMVDVAGLARKYANGRIRLTNKQNLIVLDVPDENIDALAAELSAIDLQSNGSAFRRGTVSCTGMQFCKLAVVETKSRAADIVRYLEAAIPDFRESIRISVTGCVNSCAQYQIADIGLVGVTGKDNGVDADFFQIHLGGHLGEDAGFGRKISKRIRVEETKFYIERLLRAYQEGRIDDEPFHTFIARHESAGLEMLDEIELKEVSAI